MSEQNLKTERLLSTKELMSYLGITSRTATRRYMRDGLPAYRVGLGYKFIKSEIIDWIKLLGVFC
ncbi:MAG TPA: DNA-binding protein [bacterium]|nr:DNA-binding protein [bacterium]